MQPILAAADYCGPGGEFEATLRPNAPELRHTPTEKVSPLHWEDNALKLAPAAGATHDAKRLDAKLADTPQKTARNGLVRAGKSTTAKPPKEKQTTTNTGGGATERRGSTRKERTKEENQKLRAAALKRVGELGSSAFRLSRVHLLALARALGVRSASGAAPSKKELFRLVTAELPCGAGDGLRPGRPGREQQAL